MTDTGASLPPAARSKDSPFYTPKLDTLSQQARKLLESYSGIEPDHVIEHVEDIVRPLPPLQLHNHPLTNTITTARPCMENCTPTHPATIPSHPIQKPQQR